MSADGCSPPCLRPGLPDAGALGIKAVAGRLRGGEESSDVLNAPASAYKRCLESLALT